MLKILGGILSPITKEVGGIFKRRSERKARKEESRARIDEARTQAAVDRILSNTDADNNIDLITAENKRYTWKDDIVTYLFLTPVVIATAVPFITASDDGNWKSLNDYVLASYNSLDALPTWYKWALAAVIIDSLGFRSFSRKVVNRFIDNKFGTPETQKQD